MKYNRLRQYKIKKIVECFYNDLTASSTAKLLKISRDKINAYFKEFHIKILENLDSMKVTLAQKEFVEKEAEE